MNLAIVFMIFYSVQSCTEKQQNVPEISEPELISDGYQFTEGPF